MADYRLPFTGEQVENILTNATPESDLTQETQRATEAEQQLQSKINQEAQARENADSTLQQNINNEAQARQGADTTLQGNIDAEVLARQEADSTLQDHIDTEATARANDVDAEETRAKAAEKANADDIDAIEEKIPAAASSSNQLADKQFVNSSIQTSTAEYKGAYNLVSDLHLVIDASHSQIAATLPSVIVSADNNDYCFVQIPVDESTPTVIGSVERYKYNGSAWLFEYALNNSGFTQAQWDALNSGIVSGDVTKLRALPTNVELTTLLAGKQATLTFDATPTLNSTNPVTSGGVKTSLDAETLRASNAEQQNARDIAAEVLARGNADTTLQGNIDAEELRAKAAERANADDIDAIEAVIPSAASSLNQLADKDYVNSSITTSTATFQGTYNLVTDLQLTVSATRSQIIAELATAISGADNNDYCFVQIPTSDATPTEIARVERYKFNGSAWSYEYTINNSGFTSDQWAALNSGITLALVAKLSDLPSLAQLTTLLGGKQDTLTFDNQPTASSNNPVKSGGIVDYIASALASYYTKTAMDTLLAGKQATLTFDATPTLNSTNPVQSNGIKVALDSINEKIPAAAAAGNQLADKAYLSAQVQEYAGTFRGTFNSLADLEAVTGMHHNDYAWVKVTDSDGDNDYDRYKYNGTAWVFEYRLNNTHFTATELAAIRSGITAELVTKLTNLPPTAAATINATTGADTITNGKKFFVGTQGADGKWTLESLTPTEMQKCAYAYQAGATVGTNPAHLQGTDANGDPERITPAALASLLGAICPTGYNPYTGDMNDLESNCWGYCASTVTNLPSEDTTKDGSFIVFNILGGYPIQIYFGYGAVYFRRQLYNAWSPWSKTVSIS